MPAVTQRDARGVPWGKNTLVFSGGVYRRPGGVTGERGS